MAAPLSSSPRVAVVDYGAGNLRSVSRALARSGLAPEVTGDPAAVASADAVVLPGVGAFRDCVRQLAAKGLDTALRSAIEAGRPYLGLCLGLQVLFDESDEHGCSQGLGLLGGRVERFADPGTPGAPPRVPHIGWNTVRFRGEHPMLRRLPEEDRFYFVHAYRAVPRDASLVVGEVEYGGPFCAAVAVDNIFAVQFHPEKSQNAGRRLLDAFAAWISE